MKYLCVNCNYVYDEAFGDNIEQISAGTKIENISRCPICEEFDTFENIKEEVIYIEEDTNDLFEIQHFIDINIKDDIIEVIIGGNTHPMGENHRIAWGGIFDEYGDLLEEKFLSEDSDSILEFINPDLDEFEVKIKCSEHKIFARKFVL